MKGIMQSAFVAVCAAGALGSIGCTGGERCRNLIDPCRQERYAAMARQEVIAAFTPQVQNGRILDQTIWNHDFEAGTDKLHAKGMDKLDQIVRRRPEPDPRVFLATAHDVAYNPEKANEYADVRRDLDAKRAAAIQKYLGAQTAGRPMTFDVLIHDPAEPGLSGVSARALITAHRTSYSGSLGSDAGGNQPGASTGGYGSTTGGGGGQPTGSSGYSSGGSMSGAPR